MRSESFNLPFNIKLINLHIISDKNSHCKPACTNIAPFSQWKTLMTRKTSISLNGASLTILITCCAGITKNSIFYTFIHWDDFLKVTISTNLTSYSIIASFALFWASYTWIRTIKICPCTTDWTNIIITDMTIRSWA